MLKKKGYEVYALDPLYSKEEIKKEFGAGYLDDFSKMDAIILMNKESRYKNKLLSMKSRVVDVKNILG